MKLYINNLNINILGKLMNSLDKYLTGVTNFIQIYSTDGIYQLDDKIVHKLTYVDSDVEFINNYYNKFSLIKDDTYCTKEPTTYINPSHISITIKKYCYKIVPTSKLKLIIEGNVNHINSKKMNDSLSQYDNINPDNLYFELPDNSDINIHYIKKEIIEFLSLLNNII